jgi:hypothetical protein
LNGDPNFRPTFFSHWRNVADYRLTHLRDELAFGLSVDAALGSKPERESRHPGPHEDNYPNSSSIR